jgi:DNA polymerase-3 subunit epsilon
VRDFLLFIDTEASGLPKNWDLPYSAAGNWPYAVQISWLVYSGDGIKIKEEDHYIKDNDFTISPEAARVHHLRHDFLGINGQRRKSVLQCLTDDLLHYRPMLVGHFLNLDRHIIGAEYFRADMEDPSTELKGFCTMMGTTHIQPNPRQRYLRLGDLYESLFHTALDHPHDALYDATATAACFFRLRETGLIRPENNMSIADRL